MTDDLSDALLLDEDGSDNQHDQDPQARSSAVSPEDEAVFDLMDNDPDVRAAVAQEIKQRLFQQQNPPVQQQEQALPQTGDLERIRREINETEQWLDAFYEKPDTDKNYVEFQQRQDRIRRLERQERDLQSEQRTLTTNLSQANNWVDEWIQAEAQQQKAKRGVANIERYAGNIRQLASQLAPEVRANRQKLHDALRYYLEPNAYKQYNESQASRQAANRRDSGGHGAPGDASDDRMNDTRDKYADASPEERQFLKGVGLLRDDQQQAKKSSTDLIPMDNGNGYIIPIGRGKRNPGESR